MILNMTFNKIIQSILVFLVLFIGMSCSDSTSSSKKDVVVKYDIAGYYDGMLQITAKNKQSSENDISHPANRQTLLLKQTGKGSSEYSLLISNFEWDGYDAANVEFLVEVTDLNDKNKTAEFIAFKQFSNHPIIPKSEMNLKGTIDNGVIKFNADFVVTEESDFNYLANYEGEKSSSVFRNYQFSFENWQEIKNPMLRGIYQIPKVESGIVWNTSDFEVQSYIDRKHATMLTVGPHDKNILGKKSAHIRTIKLIDTEQALRMPTVYTGILYTGAYDWNFEHPQDRVRLGVPFTVEPLSIKGYYLYKPGKEYLACKDTSKPSETEFVEDGKDAFTVEMYLYEVVDYSEYLSLRDIRISPKVVGKASFTSDVETDSFEKFESKFEFIDGYKYNPALQYKLALFIMPSIQGLEYSGAINSRILIDNFEITTRQ